MDIEMKIQEKTATFPVWDLKVENGIVPILTDDKEDIQGAILACFIEKNTVPELPDVGVEWTGYLQAQSRSESLMHRYGSRWATRKKTNSDRNTSWKMTG